MAKSNKVLTIDITNESITIVEVTPSVKKQTQVHNALIFETPEDAYDDGTIRDPERIASAIREQLNANGITNRNCIFVLTSTKAVNREVLIPEVKENKIKGIIDANASEYFPVNIEDYVVSHTVLEHVVNEDKTKEIKLMVVAAPIAMVKGYYEVGSMAGLNVESIDYIGNAMLSLIKTQTSSTMTTMVIQLGSESTILNIVKGDTLLLQRTVPYGTNAVVNEVMDERGIDATTAMTLLQNERLITVDFDDNAATGAFRYLINNIGRVIDYYVSKNPDKPIDDVFLTGDGALIRGIDGLFKIQLNIQTKVMDSLYNVKFDPKINQKIYSPVYLIAPIGASFAPMGFIPVEVKSRSAAGSDSALKIGAAVCAVGAIAALGLAAVGIIGESNARAKRDSLNQQIEAISDIEQIVNEYDESVTKLDDIKTMYGETKTVNSNASEFIKTLEKVMPKNMWIQDYVSNEEEVTLHGGAQDYEDLAKMIVELKKLDFVEDVFLVDVTRDTVQGSDVEVYEFNIRAVFVDPDADVDAEETTEAE